MLAATALLSACTSATYYTPNPDTNRFEPIPEFRGNTTLALINAQPSEEQQLYHKQSKYHANYKAWTDVAIQVAQRELSARGLSFSPDASRKLKMSIIRVHTETGWTQIKCEVVMRVETGDGTSKEFVGYNNSTMAANLRRQADGAIMRVVVAMLSDPAIVEYVTR